MAGDSGVGDGSNPAMPDLTGVAAGTSSDALLREHSAFNSCPVGSKAAKEAERMGKARNTTLKAQAQNMTGDEGESACHVRPASLPFVYSMRNAIYRPHCS